MSLVSLSCNGYYPSMATSLLEEEIYIEQPPRFVAGRSVDWFANFFNLFMGSNNLHEDPPAIQTQPPCHQA
ncbi:hypothetical protein CR513_08538, partial [Mucuna pruriens]